MPTRATSATSRTGSAAKPGTAGRKPAASKAAARRRLRTFALATGARPGVEHPGDRQPTTRSFQLDVGIVERAKATAAGIKARSYDTPIQGEVPTSLAGLVKECLEAGMTHYENVYNNGEEFRRVHKLPSGPTAAGLARRAARRAAQTSE